MAAELQALPDTKTMLIVELSETRLASLILRRSTIWTYAVVGTPQHIPDWGSRWQSLTAQSSPVDKEELKMYGQNSEGVNIIPDLNQCLDHISVKFLPHFVVPVGTLSAMTSFQQSLEKRYPAANFLPAQTEKSLPAKLVKNSLRRAIEKAHPPQVDVDYTLQTVVLDEKQNKLEWRTIPIIKKGDALPIEPHRLCRAIHLPDTLPGPLNLIIRKGNSSPVQAKQVVNLDKNVFSLKCGFRYDNDQLWLSTSVLDDSRQPQHVPLQKIPANQLANLNNTLPPVKATRYVDIAFIVDGTMRANIGTEDNSQWKPDLTLAKNFISPILQQLTQDSTSEAHGALCLYGDHIKRCGADYAIRKWPLQPLANLHRLIEQGTAMLPTRDRDYEAMLESALRWANRLQWRPNATKFVAVIGYAPPHPPDGYGHPGRYGFKHEPFTSPFNWKEELKQLRQQVVTVLGIWTPYPGLDPPPHGLGADHPCMAYSRDIWLELAGDNELYILKPGDDPANDANRQKLLNAIQTQAKPMYVAQGSIPGPLSRQIRTLRCSV